MLGECSATEYTPSSVFGDRASLWNPDYARTHNVSQKEWLQTAFASQALGLKTHTTMSSEFKSSGTLKFTAKLSNPQCLVFSALVLPFEVCFLCPRHVVFTQ